MNKAKIQKMAKAAGSNAEFPAQSVALSAVPAAHADRLFALYCAILGRQAPTMLDDRAVCRAALGSAKTALEVFQEGAE